MGNAIVVPQTGSELRELRQRAGVSMDAVSARMGLPEVAISRIERGERPVPDGFPERYYEALAGITNERAQAVIDAAVAA